MRQSRVTKTISAQNSPNRADMQEKPTVALALLAAWTFWFLFFLYLGV